MSQFSLVIGAGADATPDESHTVARVFVANVYVLYCDGEVRYQSRDQFLDPLPS